MMNNVSQNKIKEYITIVEKVAKVEHRRIPSHMVDYEELVSIGIIAVQAMIKNKTPHLSRYTSRMRCLIAKMSLCLSLAKS